VALSKDLQRQNNRLEWLQSYIEEDVRTHKSVREQHEGVLMHYNELQYAIRRSRGHGDELSEEGG
jgi:hypothetical protein